MVKEERDKNQLNLQNQAKKFEKEVQDLSEMMKDSKDKLQQSNQEKAKLQGELDNASEFQKKKMDAMHAKLGGFRSVLWKIDFDFSCREKKLIFYICVAGMS